MSSTPASSEALLDLRPYLLVIPLVLGDRGLISFKSSAKQ